MPPPRSPLEISAFHVTTSVVASMVNTRSQPQLFFYSPLRLRIRHTKTVIGTVISVIVGCPSTPPVDYITCSNNTYYYYMQYYITTRECIFSFFTKRWDLDKRPSSDVPIRNLISTQWNQCRYHAKSVPIGKSKSKRTVRYIPTYCCHIGKYIYLTVGRTELYQVTQPKKKKNCAIIFHASAVCLIVTDRWKM